MGGHQPLFSLTSMYHRIRTLPLWRLAVVCLLIVCWLWRIRPLISPFDDVTDESDTSSDDVWLSWFAFLRQELLELFLQLILPSLYLLQILSRPTNARLISSAFVSLDDNHPHADAASFLNYQSDRDSLQIVLDKCARLEAQLEQQKLKQTVGSEQLDFQSQECRNECNQLKKQLKTVMVEQTNLRERVDAHLIEIGKEMHDKLEQFRAQFPGFDLKGRKQFIEMFETADAAVDLIKRRDQQLKDLFKATTELQLQEDKVGLHRISSSAGAVCQSVLSSGSRAIATNAKVSRSSCG
jgi:hypothetical protein